MTITIDPVAAVVIALVTLALWDGLRRYADARGVKAQAARTCSDMLAHANRAHEAHEATVQRMIEAERVTFDRRMADHGETVKRTEIAMGNLRDQFMAELSKFGNALGGGFGRRA